MFINGQNRAGARLTTAASLRRNPHHGIQPPQDGGAARRAESNLNDLLFETTPASEARHALSMGRACVTTSSRHRVTTSHRDRVTTSPSPSSDVIGEFSEIGYLRPGIGGLALSRHMDLPAQFGARAPDRQNCRFSLPSPCSELDYSPGKRSAVGEDSSVFWRRSDFIIPQQTMPAKEPERRVVHRSTANMCHSPGTPLRDWLPRSPKRSPDPATRSFTVLDTNTSPAPASAATRAPM